MAITSYSTLKSAVADWSNRTDLTSVIPDFVAFAEHRMARELRIRAMETALSDTIAAGVIAVPSDYIELKNAYLDSSTKVSLEKKTAEWIYRNYPVRSSDGRPLFIAREAGNFIFGPYPDSAYDVKGVYYKKLAALSDSNTSNWFITNAPDLMLFASLCELYRYLFDDKNLAKYEALYANAKATVQKEDMHELLSGSVLSTTRG